MAKEAKLQSAKKREKLVKKYQTVRDDLKEQRKNESDPEKRMLIQFKLDKLPRDSSPVRMKSRCQQCGRPRGILRKFGICRLCVRLHFNSGNIPGATKSSW